jgi:CheY-like chemotaxis protein
MSFLRQGVKMHVVVVAEDEPIIRMALVQLLIDEGFQVWEAEDAEAAIALLEAEAQSVHVLFTDVRMPGNMDGLELSHHVKAHWPWIGLLVASAHAMPTEDDLPKGARFLPKPYPYKHAVKHIRELAEAA